MRDVPGKNLLVNQHDETLEEFGSDQEKSDHEDYPNVNRQQKLQDDQDNIINMNDMDENLYFDQGNEQAYGKLNDQYPQQIYNNGHFNYQKPPSMAHPNDYYNNHNSPPNNINDEENLIDDNEDNNNGPSDDDNNNQNQMIINEPPSANNIRNMRDNKNIIGNDNNRKGRIGGGFEPPHNPKNNKRNFGIIGDKNNNNDQNSPEHTGRFTNVNEQDPNNLSKDQKVIHNTYNTYNTYNMGNENTREHIIRETDRNWNNQGHPHGQQNQQFYRENNNNNQGPPYPPNQNQGRERDRDRNKKRNKNRENDQDEESDENNKKKILKNKQNKKKKSSQHPKNQNKYQEKANNQHQKKPNKVKKVKTVIKEEVIRIGEPQSNLVFEMEEEQAEYERIEKIKRIIVTCASKVIMTNNKRSHRFLVMRIFKSDNERVREQISNYMNHLNEIDPGIEYYNLTDFENVFKEMNNEYIEQVEDLGDMTSLTLMMIHKMDNYTHLLSRDQRACSEEYSHIRCQVTTVGEMFIFTDDELQSNLRWKKLSNWVGVFKRMFANLIQGLSVLELRPREFK